jgi:hypothetical protein
LKDAARGVAAQGIERAKSVAGEVVDEIANAASREGLGADGLKGAVGNLKEGVKSVAERGIKTALGEDEPGLATSLQP